MKPELACLVQTQNLQFLQLGIINVQPQTLADNIKGLVSAAKVELRECCVEVALDKTGVVLDCLFEMCEGLTVLLHCQVADAQVNVCLEVCGVTLQALGVLGKSLRQLTIFSCLQCSQKGSVQTRIGS